MTEISDNRVETDEERLYKNFTGKLSNFLIGEDLNVDLLSPESVITPPMQSSDKVPYNLRLNLTKDL